MRFRKLSVGNVYHREIRNRAGHSGACLKSQHLEAEAGGLRVQGQPGLCNEALFQKTKRRGGRGARNVRPLDGIINKIL
jgi:hypothetical protein